MDIVNLMKLVSINEKEESNASNLKVFGVEIDKHCTDIIFGEFLNQHMLVITQYGKIGSLVKVVRDQIVNESGATDLIFSTKHIFGTENYEQQAAARYIVEKLNITEPVVMFLNLKDYERKTVLTIMDVLRNILNKKE